MDTDHIFHRLFRDHPEWLSELTGLPLPPGCKGSSVTLKQLEIRCDLFLEPADPSHPCHLVEFQLYHDHSIFNRLELGRLLLWKQLNPGRDCRRRDYRPREVEAVVIFGSRTDLPVGGSHHPSTIVLFLDELLESLEARQPGSPLLAALAPLRLPLSELEKRAAEHYDRIRRCGDLPGGDREVLRDIFLNLLLQRFKTKTYEEIRQMIAELTPLHKTRAGRDLIREGIKKGREEGREEGIEAGQRTNILEALEIRFGTVPESLRKVVESAAGQERLRALHRAAITSATIGEFERGL